MKPEGENGESSGEILVYLDKLCSLAIALGAGCLISTYLGVSVTTAWIVVGIAVVIEILFYAL